ncbi:MAG: gliding motility lipoprotein GldB [Bacteroidota bacterium]
MRYFIIILFLVGFVSCSEKENPKVDVSDIEVKTVVKRFDQIFYTTSPENLYELKEEFPYLFPPQNPDSVWVNKMTDKDELELYAETQKLYKDFSEEEKQLESLFKHIKYYYSKFDEPKIVTLLSNVDSDNRVILADSLLLISLDVFLGKNHKFYNDFPNYVKQYFKKDYLPVAVAEKFAEEIIPPSNDKSFVARMIQEGKKVELMYSLLPEKEKMQILGYDAEQMEWAEANESEGWKYFIEKLMLFSTDPELSERFINPAPFSKFYLANDHESPGRIGVWFGWQIVRSFMKNNDVTLQKMLATPNEIIFKRSKYKPKKN